VRKNSWPVGASVKWTIVAGFKGEWRNWQTRRLQVPVSEKMWGFKSPLAHHGVLAEPSRSVHETFPTRVPRAVLKVQTSFNALSSPAQTAPSCKTPRPFVVNRGQGATNESAKRITKQWPPGYVLGEAGPDSNYVIYRPTSLTTCAPRARSTTCCARYASQRKDRKVGPASRVGGYGGYFADPDGYVWEVANNASYVLVDGPLIISYYLLHHCATLRFRLCYSSLFSNNLTSQRLVNRSKP
jgi:hypothetical protein